MSAKPHDRAPHGEPELVPDDFRNTTQTADQPLLRLHGATPLPARSERSLLEQLAVPTGYSRLLRGHHLPSLHTLSRRFRRLPRRFAGHGLIALLVVALIAGGGFPSLVLGMDWSLGTAASATDHVADAAEHAPEAHHADELLAAAQPLLVAGPSAVDTHTAGDALAPAMARAAVAVASQSHVDSQQAIGNGPPAPNEAGVTAQNLTLTGVVAEDETNVRAGPGTAYDEIAQLKRGEIVKLQQRYEGWFKVTIPDGIEGWINGELLTIAEDVARVVPLAPSIPAAPSPRPEPAPEEPAPEEPAPEEPAPEEPAPQQPAPEEPAPLPETPPAEPPAKPEPAPEEPAKPAPTPEPAPTPPPSNRWVWPTSGDLTSGFGYRNMRVGRFHNGIDIANKKGTVIRAARAGTIVEAGWCSGYGYCVKINHANGFRTEYGHMAWKPPVRAGQTVDAGDLVGYMGTTYDRKGGGYSSGVHLHFTVKQGGKAVNPLRYLP